MDRPRLRKRLGQHHLVRPEICDPLVDFLRPQGRRVIEVGPGGGILTRRLLGRDALVRAVEVDVDWAFALRRSEAHPRLEIIVGDAMAIAWPAIGSGTLVTGNLPYQISTALIGQLLDLDCRVPRAAFLVQWEVAERLVALPSSPAYGSLSVLVAAAAEATVLGRVARGAFRPPPKVEGAFVGLRFRKSLEVEGGMRDFAATVRLAFAHRRKTLRNSLASGWGSARADRVVEALGRGPKIRAEQLSLDDFLRLHALCTTPPGVSD